MKFAFIKREVVETPVVYEAPDEAEAWRLALAEPAQNPTSRPPTFRRMPDADEYDL